MTVVYSHSEIVNCRLSAFIVCARTQRLLECNAYELLLDLFETKIEQLADVIETVYADLEKLSRIILEGKQGEAFDQALATLTEQEDEFKSAFMFDGYATCIELFGTQNTFMQPAS